MKPFIIHIDKHNNFNKIFIPLAIKFLEKYNWWEVAKRCREQVVHSRNQFLDLFNIASPSPDNFLGQMASIPLPITEPDTFKKKLLDIYRIQVPVFQWEEKVYLRYSIQAYNSKSDLEKLLSAVKELLL